jgi:thiol:disulfide interchange protein DsbD
VGWGFQLQDPYFITFLIALFFLIGLNMIGVFEVGLSLVGIGAKASSKQSSIWASLGTGILATIAGAPCVGPFVGGVSGLALQADLWTGLTVFGFMGLGMASPFLLCAVFPNLLKCLPKPGPWMQVFRQIMGMLLIGSALFLVWVVQQSTGNAGLLYLLCFLVLIALAGWIYGRWGSNYLNPYRNLVSILVALLVLGGFFGVSQNIAKLYGESMKAGHNAAEDTWASWSEGAVNQALSNGQIAFVDFTASWCLICQSNKVLVLRTPETEALFEKYKVMPFTADWTLRNSEITRALESYKRSGVPLYLFLTPEGGHKVLPQNLSHSIIEDELMKLLNEN